MWDFTKPIKEEKDVWDFTSPVKEEAKEDVWDFVKPLQTRGEVVQTREIEWTFAKPTRAGKLIQDVQKITAPLPEAPEEEPIPGIVPRVTAAVVSPFESSLFEAAKTINSILGIPSPLEPPVTTKLRKQYAWEIEEAKGDDFKEIAAGISVAGEQLVGLFVQMGILKKIPGVMPQVKLGIQSNILRQLLPMAVHGAVTTPGSPAEKLQASLFRVAASITPLIINTTGATGFGAVACDTLLNMALSNKTYTDAFAQSDNPMEFIKTIIPQLIIDIGMAWNTRGSSEAQMKAVYNKYEKQAEKVLKLQPKEFTDMVKLAQKVDAKLRLEKAKKGTVLEQQNIVMFHKARIAQEDKRIAKLTKIIKTGKFEDGESISKDALRVYEDDLIMATESKERYMEELDTAIKRQTEQKAKGVIEAERGQLLLDIEKEAEVHIEDYTALQTLKAKVGSILGIQEVMKEAGAPETGFHLKNYPGMVAYGHNKGMTTIRDIVKIAKEAGISKGDFTTFAEITYAIESGRYRETMDAATLAKYQPIIDMTNAFYKGWEKQLKEIGWLEVPFPQSLINRNETNIKELEGKLKDAEGSQAKMIQKEIAGLKEGNERIKAENLSFVSVPIRMILKDMDAAVTKHFMSILPKWGRKTITIKDLVEEGVITEKEADIRAVLGEYTNRMSKKYALGLVFKSAKEEGLIKPQSQQPNWDTFDEKLVPQLKGQKVHPIFNDLLVAYFGAANAKVSNWQQVVGLTKMMQFYNPLFLPMYDVVQGAAAGSMVSWKTPVYFAKGIKDVLTQSDNFWEAFREGIFSKPFYMKEDEFTARLNKHIEPNTIRKLVKGAIPAVYTLSWNTAWKMDEMVRMTTYNYFKDKGMSSRESAQTAAMFHGDYASLPPNTRKHLNTVLFTPTFKVAMTKLGINMVKGAAKTAFDYTHATKTDKAYAMGLVRAYAVLEGIETFMHHLGYETDEKFRKYTKECMTDDGLKESTMTFSHPLNLLWRYYYRGKKVFEPDVQNKFDKFCEQAEYELTPIYRIALDIRRNKYKKVYNPNDDGDKQLGDVTKYAIGEIVAISKQAFETEATKIERAKHYKVLKKQIGELQAAFITPFVFHYTRDIHDVRLRKRIQTFKKANAGILDYKEGETIDEQLERYDNYIRKLETLYEQY